MDVRAPSSFSVLIVAVALGLAGVAHAQEPGTPDSWPASLAPPSLQPPPAPPAMQAPAAQPAQAVSSPTVMPGDKSPATALSAAVLGTAAGFGMMAIGARTDSSTLGLTGLALTVVGPSFGHFYAGEVGSGLTQTGLRAASVGAMVGGAIWLLVECFDIYGDEKCSPGPGPTVLIAGGLIVGTSSALYSIYDAPRAARRQNARARRFMFTPAPLVGPDHSSGFGLNLSGQF